jgi:hypothetical protein
MAIRYTYTDATSGGDAYIPPGEYQAQVIEYQFGLSKAGNDKLDIKFRVLETGTTLSESIAFTEKAQWKFDLLLKCISPSKGVRLPAKGQQIEIDASFINTYLLNGVGRVTVGEEEYNNQMRSRIIGYIDGKPDQTTTPPPQQGYQQRYQQPPSPPLGHQPPPLPAQQTAPAQHEDEELPF